MPGRAISSRCPVSFHVMGVILGEQGLHLYSRVYTAQSSPFAASIILWGQAPEYNISDKAGEPGNTLATEFLTRLLRFLFHCTSSCKTAQSLLMNTVMPSLHQGADMQLPPGRASSSSDKEH